MKVSLEILSSAYILNEKSTELPNIKTLVTHMMTRRRLTKASKMVVELLHQVQPWEQGRIVCGSAFGELETTANILNAIKNDEPLSPTDFQNSVYNTAVSYLSILNHNQHEILTISSGDKTSLNVLKAGALKALDGDTLLLLAFETLDIPNIAQVNHGLTYLECGIALVVRLSTLSATLQLQKSPIVGLPCSMSHMMHLAMAAKDAPQAVVEITL